LSCEKGVDKAIVNEFIRENRTKLGLKVHTLFKVGSFDSHLLESLLHLNGLLESTAIEYAVSPEGKMTNFCRQQNYPLEKDSLLAHVEVEPSRSYGLGITILLFLPFLNELDVIPTQYLNQLPEQRKKT